METILANVPINSGTETEEIKDMIAQLNQEKISILEKLKGKNNR